MNSYEVNLDAMIFVESPQQKERISDKITQSKFELLSATSEFPIFIQSDAPVPLKSELMSVLEKHDQKHNKTIEKIKGIFKAG